MGCTLWASATLRLCNLSHLVILLCNMINPRWLCCLLVLICICAHGFAQVGGKNTYDFLRLSPSARTTALAGTNLAVADQDVALMYLNPALLNPDMHKRITASTEMYFAGINHGYFAYVHDADSIGTFGASLKYISYGEFDGADVQGNRTANFTAGEYAFNFAYARHHGRWSYGPALKLVTSGLETYNSWGVAIDLGVHYHSEDQLFGFSLVAKNMGWQLTTYEDERESLPFDLQLGISRRLKHLPFRFSLLAHDLHRWDLRYDDPALREENIFVEEDEQEEKKYIADKIFRHLTFGGEFYLGKSLRVRAAYNYQRRQELKLNTLSSMAGVSFGVGIKIRSFRIDYGRSIYHLAGGANNFTISVPLYKELRPKG